MAATDTRTEPLAMSTSPQAALLERRDDPVAGIVWVTIAMALFAILAAASRVAIDMGYHSMQVVFLRNAVALALLSLSKLAPPV